MKEMVELGESKEKNAKVGYIKIIIDGKVIKWSEINKEF